MTNNVHDLFLTVSDFSVYVKEKFANGWIFPWFMRVIKINRAAATGFASA